MPTVGFDVLNDIDQRNQGRNFGPSCVFPSLANNSQLHGDNVVNRRQSRTDVAHGTHQPTYSVFQYQERHPSTINTINREAIATSASGGDRSTNHIMNISLESVMMPVIPTK